jgi:PAS domain S-box-containing protein
LQKLREENKTLQAILNSLADGVVVTDKEGKFLFINTVAEKIVGVSSENVKPGQWASAYGAYHLDKVTLYSTDRLPLARAIKGEKVKHEVIFIKNAERPNGVYIDVSASPLKNKKGAIEGGTIIFRDITERIQAEIAKKENEKRLNDVFNKLPIPSYIWQQVKDDFILIKHNKAAEIITHGNVKEFLGMSLSKMYEKSPYLKVIRSNFEQCIKNKKSISHEMQYQMLITKETKDFIVSYVFVDPDLIMVHTEDITKRKLAEEELRKLSNAVEQTADSVVITDTDGFIEYVNPAFEKISGYKREEVIGQTPRILKSGKHKSTFYKKLWDTIQNGNTFRGRIINKRKNSELYWSEQTITPMKDKNGNITKYVSVLKDVTDSIEKQRQELQLKISQEQAKKLKEMDQMKSRFFANISHEFRTPLTLILGPIEKLISKFPNADIQKQAGLVKRNANHLLELINQLLDISKLEAGKLKLEASRDNIVSFVKGITTSFESMAENKDIRLRVKSVAEQIEIYFDRYKMTKIFTNLLSNALKFTPGGGDITVTINKTSINSIELKVKDTGIGIPAGELPKLFDRFYQVNISDTKLNKGTGIGLAITKELVDLHHGTITVNSKLGEWTEFKIKLPVGRRHLTDEEVVETEARTNEKIIVDKEESFQSTVEEVAEAEVMDEEKTLTLIVEDSTDVREFVKDSLGDDFQIEEAANGEQGIRKAVKIIPDIIISDIMMPKMDGNELTRILKNDEKTSHIPIILLTAKSDQESKLNGLAIGADDYLTKPFDTKELHTRIKNLVNTRRKLQEKFGKGEYVPKLRKKKLNDLEEQFMCKIMGVIENHISQEEFCVEEFAKEVGIGRVQLHRKLKALTGKSASNYLRSVRLSKAKQMIEEHKGNISEIAYSVGFSSPAYFTRCFKDEFGFPPSESKY